MRTLIIPGLILVFTVYCVVDVIRSEASDVRGLPKLAWVGLVLLFPLAGGAAWFVAGRPRGSRPPGTARRGTTPRPPVLGPDDDPDFLRTIDRPRPVDRPDPLDSTGSTGAGAGAGAGAGGQDGAGGTGDGADGRPDERDDERDDPTGRDERRP